MSEVFTEAMIRLSVAIEQRTISHPKIEKMEDYASGKYNPFFSIVLRDTGLICIWCGNIKK